MGENIAARFLLDKGFRILSRNYRTRFGEIDIIAMLGNKLSFIEVKTRTSLDKGKPYEAVTYTKKHHLLLAANEYILKKKANHYQHSLDVISIVLNLETATHDIDFFENVVY